MFAPTTQRVALMHAEFFVATHNRPTLLRAVLRILTTQETSPNWTYTVRVAGTPADKGKEVVAAFPGVEWVDTRSTFVTVKLNTMLTSTKADLILLCDDDDIQPPNRLRAACVAYEAGYGWAGVGTVLFYNLQTDMLTQWVGTARRGLIGTSLSFKTSVLKSVGGWTETEKGKDGPLARKLRETDSKFMDITERMGTIVCLQHGDNIWDRQDVALGKQKRNGIFIMTGVGCGENLPPYAREPIADLRRHKNVASTPAVVVAATTTKATETPPPPEEPVEEALPEELDYQFCDSPLTCTDAGPGQKAFIAGLVSIGFTTCTLPQAKSALQQGKKVLFHGWGKSYAELGRCHPGQVFTLWHSGWTGSDLMGEGAVLENALHAAEAEDLTLLWLDSRDVKPNKAVGISPIWSTKDMVNLRRGIPKVDRRVAVACHSTYPAPAKNSLAAIAGCVGLEADLQLTEGALKGLRGSAISRLLTNEKHTIHPFLDKKDMVALLESSQVLVHVSLSDTWPYLVMESVCVGTPVVLSDAIAWADKLPAWAQDLCLVRPATSSAQIKAKVSHLLDHPEDRDRLCAAQYRVLEELEPSYANSTLKALEACGFTKIKKRHKKPKALLLADVHGWAFDVNLHDMAQHVPELDCSFWYVVNGSPKREDYAPFRVIYLPYPYHQIKVPYEVTVASLRSAYFRPHVVLGPPEECDIALINKYRAFHTVTKDIYSSVKDRCPRLTYLTNPVNMRRFVDPTEVRKEIVASWSGNAKHSNGTTTDVKGFHNVVIPACASAGITLKYAEYHTCRLPHTEMPQFYRQSNVTLCASLYEGASNSVMEAMAMGHALVTTDVGNHREMYESQMKHFGDSGIIFAGRNPQAFERVLRSLTPERAIEMGRLNRLEIQERWSWEVWADRYREFLLGGTNVKD